MNKKIILALLGLALGSCGTPASSSNPPTGSSDTASSSPASASSSTDSGSGSASDSGASSSDSGASSSDSGSSSSSSGGESSGGDSSGSDSSQQDPSAAKKEKIVAFLTADDGGFNGGVFTVKTSILSPLQITMGQYLQNILQTQEMTATYQSVGKKAASELVSGGAFLIEVGNAVVAYQELKTAMESQLTPAPLPPVPEGVDVSTEDGAVAYFKYFLEAMYSSMAGKQVECGHKVENGFNVYFIEGSETLSDATYIDEKTDKTDFYVYDSYEKVTRHGSAPLHTEGIHGIYRSPLGGNFMGYARTHLEKIEAAVVEDAASGVFTIKFSELAKDPDAAEVNVFGNSPLSYVPDLTVSFDASGSISGFAGSMEQAKTKVEVKATLAKTGGSVTIPTNVVECEHSYPAVSTFEDEQGGGHYHYCLQCHSVFDYGHHEYHEGDEHCHVCDYVETVEAPLKEDVVLPEALSGLKIIESKATGNFLRVECLDDMYRGTTGTPLEGNYHVEFETQIKGEEDSYHVLAVGAQTDGEAKGCLYPMHWVVSYAKYVEGEPETPVVIYEKTSMLEYHETQPKKIDGMGDACHVYTVEECKACHQEYGFPQMQLDHKVEKKANQDGTYTITCSACHESAVVRIGKIEEYGEFHSVGYEYVSGNRELYEFFVEKNSWGPHQYENGVCVVCGHESTERQVVVDLSSYMGDGVTMTLNVNKDHETEPTAVSDESHIVVPMAARVPDSDEYRRGFGLLSHQDFIVVVEPVRTPIPETTCDYYETWQIAVYPVEVDEENQEFVISGEASANYKDPWDPAQIQIHEETQRQFTRQGDSCVYDCRDVCDACGETAYEFEMTLHDISVSKENDAYRLTCEHCHESVLVSSYSVNSVSPYYHVYSLDGKILEASSPEFEKEAAKGIFAFHEFDGEGKCVCGDHRE